MSYIIKINAAIKPYYQCKCCWKLEASSSNIDIESFSIGDLQNSIKKLEGDLPANSMPIGWSCNGYDKNGKKIFVCSMCKCDEERK
jgi:hypothetical protein